MFTNFFVHFGLIVTYLLLVNMLVLPILFRIYLYIFQCATKYFTYKKVFCQYFLFTIKYFFGGLKWNRTIDLTLIRRAL